MRAARWVLAGLCALATGAAAQPAAAQQGASGKPAEAEAGKPGRRPQVRTYSSVTVVDDPKQVPPLPTGRRVEGSAAGSRDKASPPAATPANPPAATPATPPAATPAATPASPPAARPATRDFNELRRELRDFRHELRERNPHDGNEASRRATPRKEAEEAKHKERPLEHIRPGHP